jgi:hypothetical protein
LEGLNLRSSFKSDDVEILLKDITGLVEPIGTSEREKLIQSGRHYSEMLPLEYSPSEKYMEAYRSALKTFSSLTADAIGSAAEKIYAKKGKNVVLVSLARAGIPIGILMKRYLDKKFGLNVKHYSISIIRGRGIDDNAMKYILKRHKPENIQFVDGWIGKGAILGELEKDVKKYGVSPELAVAADPANMTNLAGTHKDILIPSSCLNCTVSGLISRTFLRSDIIGKDDFHGAVYYGELKKYDLSNEFLENIEERFSFKKIYDDFSPKGKGIEEAKKIAEYFDVDDINFIKPGIGEATRVLLRRVPWKILIREEDKNNPMLEHILRLADEKNVNVEYFPLKNYMACGIIKKMADV